ncbi:hypothetical protein PG994_000810 [Apiospora phragmitis]|uniref:EthD domain-containing protein n=1 Tax=Apiospora phragmitis TaxID=2905665 RepID=A0ABR1X784_9PEZI
MRPNNPSRKGPVEPPPSDTPSSLFYPYRYTPTPTLARWPTALPTCWKFTVTHYRKPEHTHEAFMNWITQEHLPGAIPIFKKHGILEYSLFETPAPVNSFLKEEMSKSRTGWDYADFDCSIEYILPSVEAIKAAQSDPNWPATLKDEDK